MILEMDKLKASEELKAKHEELETLLDKHHGEDDKINHYINAIRDCEREMIDTYKATFKEEPLRVIDDVREILAAIEKEDFDNWLSFTQAYIELLDEYNDEELKTYPYKDVKEDFKSAVMFLQEKLYLQIDILSEYNNNDLGELGELPELIREKAAEWYEPEDIPKNELARIIINKFLPVRNIEHPIDRPNSVIWKSLEAIETDGQLTIGRAVVTSREKKDKDINVIMSVSWNQPGTKITTTLNEYDKRIYITCAALLKAGNDTFTTTEIHKILTGNDKPSPNQTKKINDSLTKMGRGRLYVSNIGEVNGNYKYPPFDYDGPLLSFERLTNVTVKGQKTTAIHLLCEPRLITFARSRDQITSYKKELLQVPLNDTEENLKLQDYLLTLIARYKNGDDEEKKTKKKKTPYFEILFRTIKENCNIGAKHFDRIPAKIDKILGHYREHAYIIDYAVIKDRVLINLMLSAKEWGEILKKYK